MLVQAALPDPRTAKLKAKFRLHTQFDLERGVPIRVDVTEGVSRGGPTSGPCWPRLWSPAAVT